MSVYDLEGTELNQVYDIEGTTLNQAYDIEGNELLNDNILTVMTYNVQWFTGINGQQTMQNLIISTYKPKIIGFQEFCREGTITTVGANMLSSYPTIVISNHYNYNAIASQLTLSNTTIADFSHQVGEARSYIKTYFVYDGKTICWINAHLSYENDSTQYAQAGEILAMAEEEDYAIITGDFNSYGLSTSSDDYIGLFKPFVDARYNLANSTAERGFNKTWTDATTATSLADLTYPCDNIITSGNIDILSVTYDATKLSYLDGSKIDHIPIVATLQIN